MVQVEPTKRGHKVTMTDKDSLWVHTGEGEMMHIFRGFDGVKITLWANAAKHDRGVRYTKKTHHKTVINLEPKSN